MRPLNPIIEKGNHGKKGSDTDLRIPSGAGGLISTSKDVNEFLNLLSNHKIISEEARDKMTNNLTNGDYGWSKYLGLMQNRYNMTQLGFKRSRWPN